MAEKELVKQEVADLEISFAIEGSDCLKLQISGNNGPGDCFNSGRRLNKSTRFLSVLYPYFSSVLDGEHADVLLMV